MRFTVRMLFSLVLFFTTAIFFSQSAFAQTVTNQNLNISTNADVQPGLHTYTQGLVIELLDSAVCQIWGVDPLNQQTHLCLGYDNTTGKLGYVHTNGVIGFMGNMIGSLYHTPVSTGEYFSYVGRHFGIAKTYAQTNGIGYAGLSPMLVLWTAFRNIVYLFFVVIFILIGFGIMLRFKIDPRTVMTIENQIPKLVIALLLVTFSFAIAGLLIDLMWVLCFVVINTFANAFPNLNLQNMTSGGLLGRNPFEAANNLPGGILGMVWNNAVGVGQILSSLFSTSDPIGDTIGRIVGAVIGGLAGLACGPLAIICSPIFAIGGGILGPGGIAGFLGGLIAFLVVGVAIIMALFKLWFSLLTAYLFILLEVVLAPFYIVIGVFPGSKTGFGSWIRSMVGNLLAFPAAIFLLMFGAILMQSSSTLNSSLFFPPLIGNPGGNNNAFTSLMGLGFILLTPQVVKMVKELVKAPESKQTAGISQIFGASAGNVFGFAKGVAQTHHQSEQYIIKKIDKNGAPTYGKVGTIGALFNRVTGGH